MQGALDEAEENHRSQAKILEEEIARKEVYHRLSVLILGC
jgi:hypothetical protein